MQNEGGIALAALPASVNGGGKTTKQVLEELLASRLERGAGERHRETLYFLCGRFAEKHPGPVSSVTYQAVEGFLTGIGAKARTKNNYLAAIRQLTNFARRKRYLPRGWDELDGIESYIEDPKEPEIFTPRELRRILDNSPEGILPVVCIIAFAGVRLGEVCRLDWSAVDIHAGQITVAAAKAKTRARRICPIPDNLRAWLEPYRARTGPIYGRKRKTFNAAFHKARVKAGVSLRNNGLRHSFVSYRLADVGNAHQVALEAGHSEAVLFRSYRALVTREDASTYWAIRPEDAQLRLPGL